MAKWIVAVCDLQNSNPTIEIETVEANSWHDALSMHSLIIAAEADLGERIMDYTSKDTAKRSALDQELIWGLKEEGA